MSIPLDRLRAALRWGRQSGARRTAAGGRRPRRPRCASRRARSATKAPPRPPRGMRPSSAPSRPGATGAERGRTRRRPLPSSSERLERPEKRNPSPRFQLRPIKNEHLLNLRPPRRRQRRSPLRILSSESPRRRPGSPPPKSRTLEATRSRPWDQGTGPLSAPTSAYRATTARCSRQQPRQALLAASSRQCEKCEIKTGNRCRKWWG